MGNLVLQTRHRKLLSLLHAQGRVMAGLELAAQLDVTPRTIRSDVQFLNRALSASGVRIQSLRGKGYALELADSGALQSLLNVGVNLQTREDRARYLTLLLALSDRPYPLDELEECLFVSRTTLEHDIRFMQEEYEGRPPYLHFHRRGSEIWAEDNERRRRVALSRLFVENWESHAHTGLNTWDTMLEPEDFSLILSQAARTLGEYEFEVDDYGMMDVVFTIAIAHMRIQSGHVLEEAEAGPNIDPRLMTIANQMLDGLEANWGLPFNYPEREEIAHTLQLRQTFAWKFRTRRDLTRYVRPSRIQVAQGLLDEIKALYQEDLGQDDALFIALVRHIAPLVARVRFKYERRNPILRTIKAEYPLAMEYAVLFQQQFFSRFQYLLSEDELSLIAAHLQLALERRRAPDAPGGIPAAFVSHICMADSLLFLSQIRAVFGGAIDLKGPFSTYEKEKIRASGARLILSTLQLEGTDLPPCPQLLITAPLGDQQILQISRALRQIRSRAPLPSLPQAPSRYCAPALFFPELDADTPEKILQLLGQRLQELGLADDAFQGAVLERERISPTAFEPGIALPHALRVPAGRTAVAAARLKRPVWWGDQKVQLVILPALSAGDLPAIGRFLALGPLFQHDRRLFDQLLAAQDFPAFFALLDRIF